LLLEDAMSMGSASNADRARYLIQENPDRLVLVPSETVRPLPAEDEILEHDRTPTWRDQGRPPK